MIRGNSHHSIREIESLKDLIRGQNNLRQATIQNIDFTSTSIQWSSLDLEGCTFLGCTFHKQDLPLLIEKGAFVFPAIETLPYNPYRAKLYNWEELLRSINGIPTDLRIYEHFSENRFSPSVNEALYQRIHDHAIDDALRDYLGPKLNHRYEKKCVGIMGGHGTLRTDPMFKEVAKTAFLLGKAGFLVVSGGGPGIMEACNLGAYMSAYTLEDLEEVLKPLESAPHYEDKNYMPLALDILKKYPDGAESLAIPTWFYGHEPSNVFASHIAKYFSNSIREDNLLALCLNGIIFAPGSAGTTQEIFQDAAQNHYVTFDYISPMVFLGKERYEKETPLFSTLQCLAEGRKYKDYLFLTNSAEEAVNCIRNNPPLKVK
jgi:predicted Rossmann-fold nucleotide-binding protein